MRRFHLVYLTFVLVGFAFQVVQAQDDPKAVIQKAVAAHGGEDKIARLNKVHSVAEGTIDALPGQPPAPFVGESWRMDGNSKMTVTLKVLGMKMTVTDAVQGDTHWRQVQGRLTDLSKEEVAEIEESRYVDQIAKLGFLKDAAKELASLPEQKIADKPAVGVLVKSQGHKDVKLYFDKESGLLTKIEHSSRDLLSGKDVLEELVLSDYQDQDGLRYAMRSTLLRDGKKIMDGKVTKLEFDAKLDEATFARP